MWEIKAWEVWEQARSVRKERSLRKSKICDKSLKSLGCMRCIKKSEMWEIIETGDKKWDVRE